MVAKTEPHRRTFDCPVSETRVEVTIPPRKSAEEFCPTCDFPMFWADDVTRATKTYERQLQAEAAKPPTPTPTEAPAPAPVPTPAVEVEMPEESKRWTTRRIVLTVLAVLVALGLVAAVVVLAVIQWG